LVNLPKADPARPKADLLTEFEDDDSGVDNVRDRGGAGDGYCKSLALRAVLAGPIVEEAP